MPATDRQIDANRRNAALSTGPRTDEGKDRSRRNALTHGLTAIRVVTPDQEAEAVARRASEWNSSLRPHNPYEVWLVDRVAEESIRLETCVRLAREARIREAARAVDLWGFDRFADAERLALGLARRPALVSVQLASCKAGGDWLHGRWEGLKKLAEAGGVWTAAQRRLALDMLGIPLELRADDGTSTLSLRGDLADPAGCLALARANCDLLERPENRRMLDRIDDEEKEAAMLGLNVSPSPASKLLHRYETACHRRLRWALDQLLKKKGPGGASAGGPHKDVDRGAGANAAPELSGRPIGDWMADLEDADIDLDLDLDDEPTIGDGEAEAPGCGQAARSPLRGNRRARRAALAESRRA